MSISTEVILAIVAGFSFGCLITTLIAILINSSQQKKIHQSAQNRQVVVNSIGKLCASIENAYSAYRIGTMDYNTLRNVLVEKVDKINTSLNGNIDILDSYYIKNIERFIVDQKCFLMHREADKPVSATGETVRGVSRGLIQDVDQFVREEPLPTFEPETKVVTKKVPPEEDIKKSVDVAVAEKPTEVEKITKVEKPKEVKKPEKIERVEKEEKLKKVEKPKEIEKAKKKEEPKKEEKPEKVEKVEKEEKPKKVEKPKEIEKPKIPETKAKEDKSKEALSAFELGATAAISLDTIKKIEKRDEPVSVEKQPAFDTPIPVSEAAKDEAALKTSADVDATQIFDVRDLMGKKQPKLGVFPPVKEQEPIRPDETLGQADQKTKEVGGFFDLDIPGKPPAEKEKEDAEGDSLITGDDVMDQMDDFFGFHGDNK